MNNIELVIQRNREMYKLKKDGISSQEIADKFGISFRRTNAILAEMRTREMCTPKDFIPYPYGLK